MIFSDWKRDSQVNQHLWSRYKWALLTLIELTSKKLQSLVNGHLQGTAVSYETLDFNGESGIRTHGDISATLDFESSALDQLSHLSFAISKIAARLCRRRWQMSS